MDEVKFVLKGLVLAILLTVLLQVKVGGETLEMKSNRLLHHSSVGQFLNQSAEGAGRVLRQGARAVQQVWSNSVGETQGTVSRAGKN